MANLLDYVETVKHDNFYDFPPNEVDCLVLTELAYLPYEEILTADFSLSSCLRLSDLSQAYFERHSEKATSPIVTSKRLNLLKKVATTTRYKNIKALAYISDYNLDEQKQFSAMTFRLTPDLMLVVFRGTDNTIIGWKEDFHMTYMKEIPAQLAAKEYLSQALQHLKGQFFVAGHSKGGNLSLFASSQLLPDLQVRLKQIITYDAPGLHKDFLISEGYLAIASRLISIIPQNSIVGMLLETPENARIIKSTAFGLLQHDTFTWELKDRDFMAAKNLTSNSLNTDLTFKNWIEQLSDQELKDFFDIFFGLFLEAGIERFENISVETPKKLQAVINQLQDLPQDKREILERLVKLLFDTYVEVVKNQMKLPEVPAINQLQKHLLKSQTDDKNNLDTSEADQDEYRK